jgi:asparagine synthase (glutamine-hydrolysing)
MCGIAGIILKNKNAFIAVDKLKSLSNAIKHRGPDGEGYLIVANLKATPYSLNNTKKITNSDIFYLPQKSIENIENPEETEIAFAHRRLSIIDLNETGHQPMCDSKRKNWITYNGEIYNYIELREELKLLGHAFISQSDTEVVLAAYAEWGQDCVNKFNGMWAFCLLDLEKNICFASRDRFGVKPFYFINHPDYFAFASEQKAFVKAGFINAKYSIENVSSYLLDGLIENKTSNFFKGIDELWPGNNLIYDIKTHQFNINQYYHLKNFTSLKNNYLDDQEIINSIEHLLEKAIQIRLRSDVEVGTCLSGGIDSSVIAGLIAKQNKNKLSCFTSIFKNSTISEEYFADLVINQINSKSVKIEPSLNGFIREVDDLVYSQDAPIWNTSTYAQYKVMELAKLSGIKVVLDGQGADELFGGYHHHFVAKWDNLFSHSKLLTAFSEINQSSKTISNPFLFYFKEKVKNYFNPNQFSQNIILKKDFLLLKKNSSEIETNTLNNCLINDIYNTRLKTFLKCEDRCGMWHGVESRTPFSDDVELINFLFSFDGNRKIKNGISKYLLREASKTILPKQIYQRYDKVGFETPMQEWMIKMRPQLLEEIKASNFEFVNYNTIHKTNPNDEFENKLLFKLYVLSKWQKVFA